MLKQRVITALVAVPILLAILFLAPSVLARVVIGLLFVAAAWEWSQFLGADRLGRRWSFVAMVAAAVFLAATRLDPPLRAVVFGIACVWWLAATVWAFFYPTPVPALLRWCGGLLVLVPAYVAADWLYLRSAAVLLGLLVIVWLADIGAYFGGRALGQRKLAPAISPGKTWEGVAGGVLTALLFVALLSWQQNYDAAIILPFIGLVVLVSVVGDLTVSMFKRDAGVKDSGTLLPGHGGVLDRIDSVCAAAPVFAAGAWLLGVPA